MEKTVLLRIFEKSDGGKAYLLERDGFYELREGKEDSLWKNLDVTLEEGDSFFLRKLSLSVQLFKKAAPLGPVPKAKEFCFTRCDSRKVPSSYSMDEAIREFGREDSDDLYEEIERAMKKYEYKTEKRKQEEEKNG